MAQSIDRFKKPENIPAGVDWDYVVERVKRYNNEPSDDLLYRIGSCLDILTLDDTDQICRLQGGRLTPEQRFRVLDFLLTCGFLIDGELSILIFGVEQLTQWLEISQRAYPDFEFFLVFEHHPTGMYTGHTGIDFSMHWLPRPGAPEPLPDYDFPWKAYWEHGGMFFNSFPGGASNHFEFNLAVYPNQESFTNSRWICEEGDRYTTPSDSEADLMSVSAVLNDPTLNPSLT